MYVLHVYCAVRLLCVSVLNVFFVIITFIIHQQYVRTVYMNLCDSHQCATGLGILAGTGTGLL